MHPRDLVNEEHLELVQLYYRARGGWGGAGSLPFAGGAAQQPAIVMNCFAVIGAAVAALNPPKASR